jgi:(p)ppGpp synthase/HD superfamily hydrolase
VVITAALLHDTIEDTTTDYDDLSERFGEDVADMVAALTKNMTLPEEAREAEYDARIAKADWRVRLVKLGDVYDNYCDVKNWSEEAQRSSKTRRAREKCERAIELARADAGNEMTDRAVAAVRELIGR